MQLKLATAMTPDFTSTSTPSSRAGARGPDRRSGTGQWPLNPPTTPDPTARWTVRLQWAVGLASLTLAAGRLYDRRSVVVAASVLGRYPGFQFHPALPRL